MINALLTLAVAPRLIPSVNLAAPTRAAIRAIAFSPDGKQFAAATDSGTLQLFSVPFNRAKIEQTDVGLEPVSLSCVAFSPDGERIATGGAEGRLSVFATRPRLKNLWTGRAPKGDVTAVAFNPDGTTVGWTTAPTEHAYLYEASTGLLQQSLFLLGNGMRSIRFLPDNKTLVTGGQNLTIWDITKPGEPITDYEPTGAERVFPEVAGWTSSLDVDEKGKFIVAAGAVSVEDEGETRSVVLIDSERGKVVRALAKGGVVTRAVAISRDGRFVVAGDAQGQVRIWRTYPARLRHHIRASKGEIWAVAISPKGDSVAATGDDGVIRIWNLNTGKKLAEL